MASELDMRDLASQYGLTYDELQAIPELKSLFAQAVAATYSPTRFTALLKNTNWWRTTSDAQRQYIDLQTSDPATWRQKWENAAFHANQLAVQVGLGDQMATMKPGSQAGALNWATYASMALGWSDDRVKDWLGSQIWMPSQVDPGGEAAQVNQKVHELAWLNGRSYDSSWYGQNVRDVVAGRTTIDSLEARIRREAAAEYSGFSQQILAGQDALTLAAPYVHSVSQLLEKPEGSIGLGDPLIRKAMTTTDKNGQPYSVWQLEQDTRSDERWRSTQNAQDSAMKLARGVLGDFGMAF